MLLLDAGMIFERRRKQQKAKAEAVLEAMNYMRYDALNIGSSEFCLGEAFLAAARDNASFPFVTSNLVFKNDRSKTWGPPYVEKTLGDIRFIILGVLPADALAGYGEDFPELEVVPPEETLARMVPRVRKQADVVLLLSSCAYLETVDMVTNVAGIDLAIVSGRLASTVIKEDKPPVFQAGMRGQKLGIVTLTISPETREIACTHRLIGLYGNVPSDETVVGIVEKALKPEPGPAGPKADFP